MTGTHIAQPTISREQLRDFHVAGRGLQDAIPRAPMQPIALDGIAVPSLDVEYPLYVDMQNAPRSVAALVRDAVGVEYAEAVAKTFRNVIGDRPFAPMDEIRSRVVDQARTKGMIPAEQTAALNSTLPSSGWVVPFSPHAATVLHACAIVTSRAKARGRFLSKIRHYRDQLQDLLPSSSHSTSAEGIVASLAETKFFDADVLADALKRPLPGHRPMNPERRTRILDVLATLEAEVRESEREPAFWIFDARPDVPNLEPLGGRARQSGNSFLGALQFCQEQLDHFGKLLRALRTARLEIAGAFNVDNHGLALNRLDWQSADADELMSIPPVLIVDTAHQLAEASLTAFGRLLRSALPVHIVIADSGVDTAELGGFVPDFGYIAIAHREAYVVQSSLARPGHLTGELEEMARMLRPAVAVVSVPRPFTTAHDAWREAFLLQLSRAFPLYSYNPQEGESWSERFSLQCAAVNTEEPLTAAHAAAVSEGFLEHFRLVPRSAWSDEQVELASFLLNYRNEPPLSIPYLMVASEDGPKRAVITRKLANLCRDRMRAMRIFEELAGVRNSYVEAAVAKTRAESHDEAKVQGATEAIYRVVAMLTDTSTTVTPVIAPPLSIQPDPAPAPAPVLVEEAEDPYIESTMCTSCNDCMKVNPRLFLYNAEKQAYLGDPRTGTYAELVKAAEACPAKCIHPGTPRPGDATATPALRAKAAKLK